MSADGFAAGLTDGTEEYGQTVSDRFWAKVNKTPTCWEWTGHLFLGYGRFHVGDAHVRLDHLCRNRACVNPDHLEPVSNRENVLRGVGITAINATKTHCPAEHEYTPENTKFDARGRRYCRECRRVRDRRRGRKPCPDCGASITAPHLAEHRRTQHARIARSQP